MYTGERKLRLIINKNKRLRQPTRMLGKLCLSVHSEKY
jgi:hypothetical protein